MAHFYNATPTKLRNGQWGARVNADDTPAEWDIVTITARSGKSWDATVDYVAHSGIDRLSGEIKHIVGLKKRAYPKGTGKCEDCGIAVKGDYRKCYPCLKGIN